MRWWKDGWWGGLKRSMNEWNVCVFVMNSPLKHQYVNRMAAFIQWSEMN